MEGWEDRAACKDMGPATFFDPSAVSIDRARTICNRCPVWAGCLAEALTWPPEMDHGIRGGLTRRERADMRTTVSHTRLDPTLPAGLPGSIESRPAHGTRPGYDWERAHGIEPCRACRNAEAEYRRRVADDQAAALAPDDPRHGTARGYRLGCRDSTCPATPSCADVERERYSEWRARRRKARYARTGPTDWSADRPAVQAPSGAVVEG